MEQKIEALEKAVKFLLNARVAELKDFSETGGEARNVQTEIEQTEAMLSELA